MFASAYNAQFDAQHPDCPIVAKTAVFKREAEWKVKAGIR